MLKLKYGPENPDITYVPHKYPEHFFDTGEIMMNYAMTGSPDKPAILLIPAQTESWWGYEAVMGLLSEHFQIYAIDLRGQGRSSRTPGRYTYDNMGNDLVRFITFIIKRPVVVAGVSSGGVLSAWLSAYAPPGLVRGAYYEDPALFVSELTPPISPSVRQFAVGKIFGLCVTYLGDQWCVGDWKGLMEASGMPPSVFKATFGSETEPQQRLKEYDPEWGRATISGSLSASCDHTQMLSHVKCPVLFTLHSSFNTMMTGTAKEAIINDMIAYTETLIKRTGQPFTFHSFPDKGHLMHTEDPQLYRKTFLDWVNTLPSEAETRKRGVFSNPNT
jgi:pimeloyl-ACP methyl ester carboxylesterase